MRLASLSSLALLLVAAARDASAHGGVCADDEFADYVSCNATVAATSRAAAAAFASLNSTSPGYANASRSYWCDAVPALLAAGAACVQPCVVNSQWDSGAVDAVAQCRAWGWEAKAAQFGCARNATCCSILVQNAPKQAVGAKTGCPTAAPSDAANVGGSAAVGLVAVVVAAAGALVSVGA